MSAVNVVFASDKNYLKYTAVTLYSLLDSMGDDNVCVYILTDEYLDESELDKLRSMTDRNVKIINIVIDATKFTHIKTTPGITLATYYRLVMHDYLPDILDRCIYLDSDLIIRESISNIYNIPMEGFLFAGVEDSISHSYNDKFDALPSDPHINAGVTLFNLKLARDINFSQEIDNYISSHKYRITLGDQQIINRAFPTRIKYISPKWNVHGSMFIDSWRKKNASVSNSNTYKDLTDAANNPSIIHYTYKRKPWISLEHPRATEWWDCATKTPFFSAEDKEKLSVPAKPHRKEGDQKLIVPSKSQEKLTKKFAGYIRSIRQLRTTRLTIQNLEKKLAYDKPAIQSDKKTHLVPYYLLSEQNAIILESIGKKSVDSLFNAKAICESLVENSKILTNGEPRDLDGGFHENIKTILRTSGISRSHDLSEVDLVLVLVQRLRQELYWKMLSAANNYGKKILFAETSFFGAFAPYFEENVPGYLRRSFGYIFDDMGYYFDARNPSRLEQYLNSECSILSENEQDRSREYIEKVISEGITKYNYTKIPHQELYIPPNSVLLVDQKSNDASIEFSGASKQTFSTMILAALEENPESNIYLKLHPDNLGVNGHVVDKRVTILPDTCQLTSVLDQVDKVYVVSSQVGFEALLRGKEVHTFGIPFYSGWGLTVDRQTIARRTRSVTVEELFYAACIKHSVYINPFTGLFMDFPEVIDLIVEMRLRGRGA